MDDLLEQYSAITGPEIIYELSQMARILKGAKVLHVNSTKTGGGVAEILNQMVPLMNALGIDATWEVMEGTPDFFECTKQFHNGMQGKHSLTSSQLLKVYEDINAQNAERLQKKLQESDFVFIHDPQPAALISFAGSRKNKWIWRCHIDASQPQRSLWRYLRGFIHGYDASIFSLVDFVQPLPHPIYLIAPSIDPLTEKNMELTPDEIAAIFPRFQIDPARPFILQVSRFDYFKDPLGVIEAYLLAKKFKRGLQLVLAGGGAPDDPEGEKILKEVQQAAKGDPDIHILFLPSDSHRTINALQRASTLILQKSLREGFGLTVTEALWKNKPVIGGNCGGIRLQVINYHTGFLVETPEGAAERIRYLLQNTPIIKEMGEKGSRFVRDNFLITRHLRDYFSLMIALKTPLNRGRIEINKMGFL